MCICTCMQAYLCEYDITGFYPNKCRLSFDALAAAVLSMKFKCFSWKVCTQMLHDHKEICRLMYVIILVFIYTACYVVSIVMKCVCNFLCSAGRSLWCIGYCTSLHTEASVVYIWQQWCCFCVCNVTYILACCHNHYIILLSVFSYTS